LLSRHEAGVPTGARGRLGGFLSRRTQTCSDRIAARRWEVPPERARTIRQKGTFRRGGIAFQGRGRNVEVKAVAAAGMGLRPSVRLSRVRKRGPKNIRHDLARPETRPNRDAAGRDSSRGDDRSHRSARLAELKTGLQRDGDRFGGGLCQAPRRHSRALGVLVRVCLALTCLQDRLGADRCNTVRLPIGR
jgi:hypothetical protein